MDTNQDTAAALKGKAGDVKEATKESFEDVKEGAKGTWEQTKDKAGETWEGAKEALGRTKETAYETREVCGCGNCLGRVGMRGCGWVVTLCERANLSAGGRGEGRRGVGRHQEQGGGTLV